MPGRLEKFHQISIALKSLSKYLIKLRNNEEMSKTFENFE